ncbi:MAG: hypothetical protein M0Z80_07575 [Treponema sp.]|nr:hypothetical protein [Treponema sp.]
MTFNIAVEDDLSESVVKKILALEGCSVARRFPDRDRLQASPGKGHLLKKITAYNASSAIVPFLMMLDLDTSTCAPEMLRVWMPFAPNPRFLLRVAVRETETWLLADRHGMASFLGIAISSLPAHPEDLADPKAALIALARRSRSKRLRESIVPIEQGIPIGPDYNGILSGFVNAQWDIDEASKNSDSLMRARLAIRRALDNAPS